jgi:ubiquinone/menaquinone biosynthesis C-methylase UbiE
LKIARIDDSESQVDLLELTARAEASHFWFRGFRRFLAPVLAEIASGRPGLRLIDCGAGTGHNLSLLRPHGRVFAFDLAPTGLTKARVSGRPLVRADITRIPFRSDTFDVTTSFDVLQCVRDDAGAIGEMTRVTKRGGTIVLTLAALEMLRGDHAEFWQEERRYTPATARALARQAGLEPVRVSFLFASVFPLMLGVRAVQRLTRPFREPRADVDISMPAAPVNAALSAIVSGEAVLARRVRMPVGSSLLVVARKR